MLLWDSGRIDLGFEVADLLVEFTEPALRSSAELDIAPALEVDIVFLEYECQDLLGLLGDGARQVARLYPLASSSLLAVAAGSPSMVRS